MFSKIRLLSFSVSCGSRCFANEELDVRRISVKLGTPQLGLAFILVLSGLEDCLNDVLATRGREGEARTEISFPTIALRNEATALLAARCLLPPAVATLEGPTWKPSGKDRYGTGGTALERNLEVGEGGIPSLSLSQYSCCEAVSP